MNHRNAPYWTRRGLRAVRKFVTRLWVPLFVKVALGVWAGLALYERIH